MIAIRLDSPGDPVFTHHRVGKDGKLFNIYKFRTMIKDAEKVGPALTEQNDSRITKLGHFLRRSSIDELPQILNVIKGEMSFIGPRPEIPSIVDTYTPQQRNVLKVRPGLSGWAQIHGRDELSIEEKSIYDQEYVEKVSLFMDIKIFVMTFPTLLSSRGTN